MRSSQGPADPSGGTRRSPAGRGARPGSGEGKRRAGPAVSQVPEEAHTQAMERSFRLLAVRARSAGEIEARLRRSGHTQATIERVVARLCELGYLDDHSFAKQWVAERGTGPKASGRIKLEHELRQKGIPRRVIDEVFQARTVEREAEAALAACRAFVARTAGLTREKAQRQIYAGMVRRGFAREAILRALREALGPVELEE